MRAELRLLEEAETKLAAIRNKLAAGEAQLNQGEFVDGKTWLKWKLALTRDHCHDMVVRCGIEAALLASTYLLSIPTITAIKPAPKRCTEKLFREKI